MEKPELEVEKMKEITLESLAEPLRTSFRHLVDRCEKAGIEYGLQEIAPEHAYLTISLQSGREKRTMPIFDLEDAKKLINVEFEKYVFIEGYEAICSYQDGSIEAYIKFLKPFRAEFALSKLLNIPYSQFKKMKKGDLVFEVRHQPDNKNPITIAISQPSNTILALTWRESDEESGLTIKIKGLEISNNNKAVAILQSPANSLLFEIGTSQDIPLMLEMHQETAPMWFRVLQRKTKGSPIVFPKYQYDVTPLNLYWHAASAYKMPLLQFLAYYQVLEFYFPIYSRKEVQLEVANIIKDTEFNPDHHLDINKVISAVLSKMGRGYGDERSQMRATIKACVQDTEARELVERDYIKEYFKHNYKKLSQLKVSIDNKDLDLREQVADRLYDIRCRIVHTKADERERERILPFTKEESLLMVEVDIIEFMARKTLIAGSKKLVL